jgi:hypothetical protein
VDTALEHGQRFELTPLTLDDPAAEVPEPELFLPPGRDEEGASDSDEGGDVTDESSADLVNNGSGEEDVEDSEHSSDAGFVVGDDVVEYEKGSGEEEEEEEEERPRKKRSRR